MNWQDVVPGDVAERQQEWELRQTVLRARKAGLTLKATAARLNTSINKVRQYEATEYRRAERGFASPIEQYLARSLGSP